MIKSNLAIFQGKQIRKTVHDGEWWFAVVDVVGVLTDSADPRDYWYRIKNARKFRGLSCRQFVDN